MSRTGARVDPPYVRIASELRRRITAGELRAGERVPSTRQLAQEWGVALATATRALDTLRHEGLVEARPRVGTRVAAQRRRAEPTPRAPRRRAAQEPGQELRRERIVQAAIGIADAQGLHALSMRSVAARLGVPTMSLYGHVSGKDELVVLMADAVFAERALPAVAPPGWRARLEVMMRLQWSLYTRHPWLARVGSVTRPQLIPNGMAHTEWALQAVEGQGLDATTMLHVYIAAYSFVRGVASDLEAEAEAEAETGMTRDEWMAEQDATMATLLASGRFPMLSRLSAQPDVDVDLDALFEFGMQRLLDGLAVFLGRG